MGEIKHTPGPWEVRYGDEVYAGEVNVADAWPCGVNRPEEVSANARLIAAAPEMKEALEEVLRWDAYPNASCRNRIEAALAKANGERPPLPPTARCE